jgi:membrane peptidoglycan carboxypeptidase
MTKDEVLELYLNIVEFGPSLYGIREASHHYFGRPPRELNLVESVYLVKLLPSPVKRHGSYVRGEVSERKLASLHKVMRTMRARGRITEAELKEGLEQQLVFHHPGDPPPEPREPVEHVGLEYVDEDIEYGVSTEEEGPEWGDY